MNLGTFHPILNILETELHCTEQLPDFVVKISRDPAPLVFLHADDLPRQR